MSKTPTTSAHDEDAGADARYHSEYVPRLKSAADRERFKESMLDELAIVTRLGHLRPASETDPSDSDREEKP